MKTKFSNYLALFCFALSLVFVGRAILATDSAEASVDLQAITEVSSELAIKPASVAIEEIRIGDRVLAHNPEESEADRSRWTEPYWDQWLTLDLEMQKEGGGLLQIKLLRSRDWLQAQLVPSSQSALQLISGLSIDSAAEIETKISTALSAGLAVEMDLPELGLTGHAKVLAIGPPPLVESGAGQVVTATFRHSSVDVIDLTFVSPDGAEETLGTTSNHPFWSVDQQEFVQAGSLKENERLLSFDGQIQQVVHAESRIAGDPVFNIEVHQEHVYFVGDSNVLVHNMGKEYARVVADAPKTAERFASTDPLVTGIANQIENRFPGLVLDVNVPIKNAAGELVTDADILLKNAVLQIKSGGGKGLAGQLRRTEAAVDLPVIGFGPTLKGSVVKEAGRQGSLITRSIDDLLDVISP